jgi:uncharacterized protein (DUF1800 family)
MPALDDLEHLLRRTEFVARPARVNELKNLSLGDAVDNILNVPVNPGSVTFTETHDWSKGVELTHYWLNRMAHDSSRPIQEKMGFFWHGHFCSEFSKVSSPAGIREQIDTFRREGLGNLRSLAKKMSTQIAMLRYLDNNQNKRTSPNQNFARELMELFLLGVGNYTEADVEAATAAWTGHTDDWQTDQYVWRADWHDGSTKQFLGRTINNGGDPTQHGAETIDVMLGNGVVPSGANVAANRGRPTREVAAEFISRKLWHEFAGTEPPAAALAAMRDAAISNDFAIKPWLRTLLLRPEFYWDHTKDGLVRSPVEFIVAALVATGLRSETGTPLWIMDGMGQRPLYPPNVAGWKHNSYWVNASAMAARASAARYMMWRTMEGFWNGDGLVHLAGGEISNTQITDTWADDPDRVVDRIVELMQINPPAGSKSVLYQFARGAERWERTDLVQLVLIDPAFHLA